MLECCLSSPLLPHDLYRLVLSISNHSPLLLPTTRTFHHSIHSGSFRSIPSLVPSPLSTMEFRSGYCNQTMVFTIPTASWLRMRSAGSFRRLGYAHFCPTYILSSGSRRPIAVFVYPISSCILAPSAAVAHFPC